MENMDYDDMPTIGLNVMLVGITTKSVRNIDGKSVLEFYVEENLGEREPREFWIQVTHDPNLRYLANKTNSINQSMRSTTAIIMGTISYQPPVADQTTQEEISPEKHIVKLEDISLVSTNRNSGSSGQQALNVPWLNTQSGTSRGRANRTARGATPRTSRRGRSTTTLAQMNLPRNQGLLSALEANPIPNMNITTTTTTNTTNTNTTNDTATTNEDNQDE